MAASVNNPAWLEWLAGLLEGVPRQTQAATFPPDRFYCLLDELPFHLLPQHARRALSASNSRGADFVLNPECVLCTGDELPPEHLPRRELLHGFALQGTIAWVPNPRTGSLLSFWLGSRLEQCVRALDRNEPVPASMPLSVRNLLAAAHILVPLRDNDPLILQHAAAMEKAAAQFRKEGYAPLSGLIHPFHIAALRRYYRHQIRGGAVSLGDRQSSRRYVAYNDPVARFFHAQIASTLSEVAGEALKPSYVYMASYLSGAELKKHTDREQCEFSITLCLDYSPEPACATPWPIHLQTPTGMVTVYQALGDGLAYRGTRLPHYRETLGEGQTSTSIFFHYVAADFAGSLD